MSIAATISLLLIIVVAAIVAYLYLLVIASIRSPKTQPSPKPRHRFAITIPAHDEESSIENTVRRLCQLDYPTAMFDVHVVADHCSDNTAALGREAGAIVHERETLPGGSKGAALHWLFGHILDGQVAGDYDAVTIFDADTRVEPDFLRIMDARLAEGQKVVQGNHRISNYEEGWFPALTWAMFLVDNRYQNLGRSNLGWSAKHMGDSICFRSDVLRQMRLDEGLTEDYAFRQQLLLQGIRICYEPAAIGLGEAAPNWHVARAQRARWLKGTYTSSRNYASKMLREGVRRGDLALLDGALQAYLPSYSTLTIITLVLWFIQLAVGGSVGPVPLIVPWTVLLILLIVYPLWGLAFERAPLKAFVAILLGPVFILWRSWLALTTRFGKRQVHWVRTPHKGT
jgi:cellulose synthase/poly-beta-1,6-N-acetylglucosamine synthase-like glycosyltransferase